MIRTLFEWLSMLSSSVALREAFNVYPWLLTAHVVSTTIFAGLIIMMDLRLAGIGNLSTPFVQTSISMADGHHGPQLADRRLTVLRRSNALLPKFLFLVEDATNGPRRCERVCLSYDRV